MRGETFILKMFFNKHNCAIVPMPDKNPKVLIFIELKLSVDFWQFIKSNSY